MQENKKLLSPKIDYVFKRIFGHEGNEEITASLLSSIINKPISDLQLSNNPILEKDLLDDKVGILDIKAKIDNRINCDIEMQVVDKRNIEKRIMFYWSKMYSNSIKEGEDYEKLEKNIVILITNYELESLKEIKKYVTKWNIKEEEYRKIILTEVMEIYIIEIPKFKRYKEKVDNKLNLWVEFIENPEVVDMSENKEIEKAKKVLEEISEDEHERYLAELRQKYIRDQKAVEGAGFDKGFSIGFKDGEKQNKTKIIKNMLKKGIDVETIIETTEIDEKEMQGILEELGGMEEVKHERYLAELRQKYIRDQKAVEGAGFDKGFKDGEKQGISKGKKSKEIDVVKNMIKNGINIETIMLTGIDEEIVKKVIEEIEKKKH